MGRKFRKREGICIVDLWTSLVAQKVKKVTVCRGPKLIRRSGRSPGEGNGYSLQYSCLENSMDRGAWWATVHGGAESNMTEQLTLSLFIADFLILCCTAETNTAL